MWGVAETVFGDGSRVGELLDLNPTSRRRDNCRGAR
jgi:hypothetical protein